MEQSDRVGQTKAASAVRFQRAQRRQIEWRPLSLDQLLPEEHPARLVWAYVESLDLSELYEKIQAHEHGPGRNPIDPKILLALWLLATIEGVSEGTRIASGRTPAGSGRRTGRRVPLLACPAV